MNLIHYDVVAALIQNEAGDYLICQRSEEKDLNPLQWEFAGGKIEPGETKEEALIRECKEELDVLIEPLEPFIELEHSYPTFHVDLTLFDARICSGELTAKEHQELRWVPAERLDEFEFCEADKQIIEKLKSR